MYSRVWAWMIIQRLCVVLMCIHFSNSKKIIIWICSYFTNSFFTLINLKYVNACVNVSFQIDQRPKSRCDNYTQENIYSIYGSVRQSSERVATADFCPVVVVWFLEPVRLISKFVKILKKNCTKVTKNL